MNVTITVMRGQPCRGQSGRGRPDRRLAVSPHSGQFTANQRLSLGKVGGQKGRAVVSHFPSRSGIFLHVVVIV